MKLSAIMFALILNALQAPAYGETLVVAEGDESASTTPLPPAAEGEYGPLLAGAAGTVDSTDAVASEQESAEFARLFGSADASEGGLDEADQKTVDTVSAAAWPWWSVPLGLLAIGVLLIIRSRVHSQQVPQEAIHVVSRQPMGKDGTLALIEVHDGDARRRRLLVGLGGGSPRLVADISAWEVAVAAPSNIANDAVAVVGPDPIESSPADPEERRAQLHVAPASFGSQLSQAAARYGQVDETSELPGDTSLSKAELIEDVLAKRDLVRLETVGGSDSSGKRGASRKPSYSSREILA